MISHKHDIHQVNFGTRASHLRVQGFATTARLQVACASIQVIYADKSGQEYHRPTTEIFMRVNELCSVTSEKNEDTHI
jgi:hypothetical protein